MGYLDKFGFDEQYFEQILRQTLEEDDVLLQYPTMRQDLIQLCLNKGKRIRPLFLLLAATLGECQKSVAYQAAVGIELLHISSLIHDDIIDQSPTRRGVTTLHTLYDPYIALRLGDYLLNKSLSLFATIHSKEAHLVLARAMSTLCIGEFKQATDVFNFELSKDDYFQKSYEKTGMLLSTSLLLGGIIGNLSDDILMLLDELGHDIGIAYQLLDDISDFTEDEASLGKPTQTDLKNGVITLPTIYALDDDVLKDEIMMLNSDIDDSHFSFVYDKIKKSDCIKKSQDVCETFIDRAQKRVSQLPRHQDLFSTLISAMVGRH